MPLTEWKSGLFLLSRPHTTVSYVPFFVALGRDGFWPLALRDPGQPPLFWLSIPCTWTMEGPGLDTYPGIIFFIFVLGMNPASTCCAKEL